jgi:hypothetical protein
MCNCKKPTPISVFSPQPVSEPTPEPIVDLTQEEIDWYNNIDTIEPIEDMISIGIRNQQLQQLQHH